MRGVGNLRCKTGMDIIEWKSGSEDDNENR
jgi:hypothetical protein